MSVAVLVLAAGRGERLGLELPKAFVSVAGTTLIEHSIRALAASNEFDRIQPVLARRDLDRYEKLRLNSLTTTLCSPVEGGRERQDSVRAGLESLPAGFEWVAIHDSARSLVSPDDIRRVVRVAKAEGAAILAERVRDTIKRVRGDRITETPTRAECWAAQTPQVFRRDWFCEAMDAAVKENRQGTDDAELVEWLGYPVHVVEAEFPNPKLTRPEDLVVAEALLAMRKGR